MNGNDNFNGRGIESGGTSAAVRYREKAGVCPVCGYEFVETDRFPDAATDAIVFIHESRDDGTPQCLEVANGETARFLFKE